MDKRRIIISSMVGTVALLALSLSISLAWYASGDRLNVDTIEVNIATDKNLKISKSTEIDTFVDGISESSSSANFLFSPVSAMYRSAWVNEKAPTPIFYDSSNYLVPSSGELEPEPTKRGFYQERFYLLTDLEYYVGLDVNQSVFEMDEDATKKYATKLYNEYDDWGISYEDMLASLNKLINSLRISILVPDKDCYAYYIIDPTRANDEPKVVYGGRLDNSRDGYYDTYEVLNEGKYEEKEVIYGEVNDRSLIKYNDPIREKVPGEEEEPIENRKHFFGNSFIAQSKETVYTYNEQASIENGLTFVEEDALSLDDIENDQMSLAIPCHKNEPREIIVSIWLEGWDPDCINYTMGASFLTTLSFKPLTGL